MKHAVSSAKFGAISIKLYTVLATAEYLKTYRGKMEEEGQKFVKKIENNNN